MLSLFAPITFLTQACLAYHVCGAVAQWQCALGRSQNARSAITLKFLAVSINNKKEIASRLFGFVP